MNPFASRVNTNQTWVLPVSALGLVLGFLIVMVTHVPTETRFRYSDPDQRNRLAALEPGSDAQQQQQIHDQGVEINRLRGQLTQFQNVIGAQKSQAGLTKVLNDNLQEAKNFAGLSELEGPGVLVTLSDALDDSEKPTGRSTDSLQQDPLVMDRIIHDQDILRVVNELYAAGAEAISINNLRYVGTSSVRCVGPTVLIDAERIASPIKIRAIGDPDTLLGGLKMPGGVVQQLREVDPRMIEIEPVKDMTLPAYSGSTTRRYAKPVQSSK